MPNYITLNDVKVRLANKVRFQDANETLAESSDKMPIALANRLIDEAEGEVEQELSPRYLAPFQHGATGLFKDLPDRPTKNIIRTLCELKAVIRILETDFGSGSAVDGSKYAASLEKQFRKIIDKNILAKPDGMEATKQWSYPPLPSLKVNYFNNAADDGYIGGPLSHSHSNAELATDQVNDPTESFFNAGFGEHHND